VAPAGRPGFLDSALAAFVPAALASLVAEVLARVVESPGLWSYVADLALLLAAAAASAWLVGVRLHGLTPRSSVARALLVVAAALLTGGLMSLLMVPVLLFLMPYGSPAAAVLLAVTAVRFSRTHGAVALTATGVAVGWAAMMIQAPGLGVGLRVEPETAGLALAIVWAILCGAVFAIDAVRPRSVAARPPAEPSREKAADA
jgi:hypothetical protein